jgi:hypothetical protein
MIAASIAIFLDEMIALQPAGTARPAAKRRMIKGPVFCFAMQRAPQGPGGKNWDTSLRKAIKAQPVLAQICQIEVARHRPDAGDNGYADASPEHETAQSFACLTSNTEVGIVDMRRE